MTPLLRGTVVRADARVCHVELGEGGDRRVVQAAPRGKLFEALGEVKNPIAVGDWVLVDTDGDPMGIEEVCARTNSLSRVASSHDPREQVLFANVDQVVVVNSLWRPGFSSNRTDRILAACEWEEIPAVLLLNKVDKDEEGQARFLRETYEKAGFRVIETSATQGDGLEELRELLDGKTSVLYGASGVGKSTLLNRLYGLDLAVGRTSKYWASGRHTTSFSRLLRIDEGTAVIDTPGIRVFRLYGINQAQLRFLYKDFVPYEGRCRFRGCRHDHEPGCAVVDATEAGELAPTRYLSYVEILDELEPPKEEPETVGETPDGA